MPEDIDRQAGPYTGEEQSYCRIHEDHEVTGVAAHIAVRSRKINIRENDVELAAELFLQIKGKL